MPGGERMKIGDLEAALDGTKLELGSALRELKLKKKELKEEMLQQIEKTWEQFGKTWEQAGKCWEQILQYLCPLLVENLLIVEMLFLVEIMLLPCPFHPEFLLYWVLQLCPCL
ncbi:hypothetical protein RIF29_34027 [Crotalaria pallida]|uniref:Uncharacterized protein n=1 Tax=Crotalaria pallida TaxID=3830 RepID=A0AAN9HUF3_CROPI